MSEEEARALLAVEPGTSGKDLRRAYLRAVKKHKPERDPEGFKAVREAYELLQMVEERDLIIATLEGHTLEDHEAVPVETSIELPEAPDDTPPDSQGERWGEFHDLSIDGQDEEAAETALRAYEAGHADFMVPLLHMSEHAEIPDAVWQTAEESDEPNVRRALLVGLMRNKRPGRAAELLVDLLDTDDVDGWIAAPTSDVVIELIVRLVRAAKYDDAQRVLDVTSSWLEKRGFEREWLAGDEGRWLLTRELVSLRGRLPKSLRNAIAKGIMRYEMGIAVSAAKRLSDTKASSALLRISSRAPSLHAMLHEHLVVEETVTPHGRGSTNYIYILFVGMLLLGGRICARKSSSPEPVRDESNTVMVTHSELNPKAARSVASIRRSLAQGDCRAVMIATDSFILELPPDRASAQLAGVIGALHNKIDAVCDAHPGLGAWLDRVDVDIPIVDAGAP